MGIIRTRVSILKMGTKYVFKCSKCEYKLESSGKKSRGMFYVVSPYLCIDCKIISDVTVGILGESYLQEWFDTPNDNLLPNYILENKNEFYRCEECEGRNLKVWDSSIGDCPKCDGNLSIDKDSPITLWD